MRLDGEGELVAVLCATLGVSVALGETFPCVLPGHAEVTCRASLWLDERGIYVFRHDPPADGRRSFSLTELWVSNRVGRTTTLAGPAHARWKLAMLHHLGFLRPAAVEFLALEAVPTADVVAAYEGLRLLYGLRYRTEPPGSPIPLARRFLADWWMVSEGAAERLKRGLIGRGVVEQAGVSETGRWRTRLWRPARASEPEVEADDLIEFFDVDAA